MSYSAFNKLVIINMKKFMKIENLFLNMRLIFFYFSYGFEEIIIFEIINILILKFNYIILNL